MSGTRRCPRCGMSVELVHMKESGQRLLVNPGFVPVFTGTNSGGAITVARVLHWQTCPAHNGIDIHEDLSGVAKDGPWKPKEDDDEAGVRPDYPKRSKRKRRK